MNKLLSVIFVMVVSWSGLINASTKAAMPSLDDQVGLLIQWQSSQPLLQYWLAQKQTISTSPFDLLIQSHTKATARGLELQSLPPLAIEQSIQNTSFIRFAVEGYFSGRFAVASRALQQVKQPIGSGNRDVFKLINGLLAIKDDRLDAAEIQLSEINQSSELYLIAQYNLSLVLIEQIKYQQATQLLTALESLTLVANDSTLLQYVRLLQARAAGLNGNIKPAITIIRSLTGDEALMTATLQVEAEILLSNQQIKAALVPLRQLTKLTAEAQFGAPQIQLLTSLEQLGWHERAQALRHQYIGQLLTYHRQQQQLVKGVTDRDNIKLILMRTADDGSNKSVGHFSENTQRIITQIEQNNSLSRQLSATRDSGVKYSQVLNKGLSYIAGKFAPYRDSLYRSNAKTTLAMQRTDNKISELETILTELVGVPNPSSRRYQMLDGLAIWSTGQRFKPQWWLQPKTESDNKEITDSNVDFSDTKAALVALLAEPRNTYKTLLKQHIKSLKLQMEQANQRAQALVVELGRQKQQLAKQLTRSLASESNHLLADIERQLLWLARGELPGNDPLKLSLLPLNDTKKVLNLLATSAQSSLIKDSASLLLADLHLTASEQLTGSDQILFRGIDGDLNQAIKLYQGLLVSESEQLDPALITYQLARAYDLNGQLAQSLTTLTSFIARFERHQWRDEVLFRAGELYFGFGDYDQAAQSYSALLKGADQAFSERASYKLGWSYFKTGQYQRALTHFFKLVDIYWVEDQTKPSHQQRLLDDVLRIIAMTFANLDGVSSVEQFFSQAVNKQYQESIYLDLARYYQRKRRYSDAAATFESLVRQYPLSQDAPYYQSQAIVAYIEGGFPSKSWPAREQFVLAFGGKSDYWQEAAQQLKAKITVNLATYLQELAQRDHAKAQQSQRVGDYKMAIKWYQDFIRDIGAPEKIAPMYFLMAEAYSDINQDQLAANAFETAAYQFDDYDNKAQAGYRALLAYQQLYLTSEPMQKKAVLAQGVALSHRHLERFEQDLNTPFIQTKLAEDYLLQLQYSRAIRWAKQLIRGESKLTADLSLRNWRVVAHANFALKKYDRAEIGYQQLLTAMPQISELAEFKSRLAQAIYKQGEQAQQAGKLDLAITHFKRVAQIVPGDQIIVNAEFDAATAQMANKQWLDAIVTLEQFVLDFPRHQLQQTIAEKLVVAFEQTKNWGKAAQYLAVIFEREGASQLGRDALWRTAKLYQRAQQPQRAVAQFKTFIATFPRPLDDAIEARTQLVSLANQLADLKSERFWLNQIIETHDNAGIVQSERSLYLASHAALTLGRQYKIELDAIRLKLPLERSLTRKQAAMKKTLNYLNKSITYRLAQHSTAATMLVADIYRSLAQELMSSPKPRQLNALELEQYDILLEEQAYPFEDKAIEFYELNVGQIGDGIYTQWVEQSLNALREIMPARYNKPELVEVYHEAIQ